MHAYNASAVFHLVIGMPLSNTILVSSFVTRFAKTGHNKNSFYCTIMLWALKLFCSNIKSVLQSNSQLQAVKARDAIHGFVCIPMAIKNYI